MNIRMPAEMEYRIPDKFEFIPKEVRGHSMRCKRILHLAVNLLAAITFMTCGNFALAMEAVRQVREIPFSSIEGVRIGNAQDEAAKTGVTVLCFPAGAKTGVDIRGGGPASCDKPVQADLNMAGTLAAEVLAKAIEDAVTASKMGDAEYLSHCLGLKSK